MFCRRCGSELEPSARFCRTCGTATKSAGAAATAGATHAVSRVDEVLYSSQGASRTFKLLQIYLMVIGVVIMLAFFGWSCRQKQFYYNDKSSPPPATEGVVYGGRIALGSRDFYSPEKQLLIRLGGVAVCIVVATFAIPNLHRAKSCTVTVTRGGISGAPFTSSLFTRTVPAPVTIPKEEIAAIPVGMGKATVKRKAGRSTSFLPADPKTFERAVVQMMRG